MQSRAGADAALVVTPYYNKPTQEGLYLHFKTIADSADIPIVVYNVPGRSVVDVSTETMARLAKHPNIVGVKDATANLDPSAACPPRLRRGFLPALGRGTIRRSPISSRAASAASASPPISRRACSARCTLAWQRDDVAEAIAIQHRLVPLHDAMFVETNPGPVKYAGHLLGFGAADCRLPMAPVSDATRAQVRAAMVEVGLLN